MVTLPQQVFFNHIKSKLPDHLSLVEEIAELLNISNDSAYRRIRGEKPIGFDEIQQLCKHYKISLDQLLQIDNETTIFSGKLVDHNNFNLQQYLEEVLKNLTLFGSISGHHMYFMNKDIPMFHYMQFQELAAFKFFFWKRTLIHYPDLVKKQFHPESLDENLMKTGLQIIKAYNKVNSTEIWNEESIHVTIRQIEYYRQANVFPDKITLVKVYDQLEELINHIESQADAGVKYLVNEKPGPYSAPNEIYINECLLGDNSVHVDSKDFKITLINHDGLNFMATRDERFCKYAFNNLQNILKKSTLISKVGEKDRSIFFNSLREKINHKKKTI
ncbi:MAG: helix-turn-helix transcriptional regulator [Ferruginibacter sp.]